MSSTSTAQRSSLARLPAMFLVALVPVVLLEIALSVACKRRLPADDVVALAPVVLLASPVAAALAGATVFRPRSVSGLALALTAATVLFLAFTVTAALYVDSLLEFESAMLVSVGAACGFVVGRLAWWVITSLRSRPVWWKLPGIGAAAGGGAAIVGLIWLSESGPHLCCGDELLKGVPASWASACGVVLVLGLMPSGGPREETLPAEDMRRRIGKWLRIGAFALALAAMAAIGFYAGERWGRGTVVERPDLAARPDSGAGGTHPGGILSSVGRACALGYLDAADPRPMPTQPREYHTWLCVRTERERGEGRGAPRAGSARGPILG